jgi:hypothetical protein
MKKTMELSLFVMVFVTSLVSTSIFVGFYEGDSHAQVNAPKGSVTTMIGNATIPGVTPHVNYKNVTSNTFNKDNTTAPISPTGISTQSKHLPPAIENTTNAANNATMPNTSGTNATAPKIPSVQK